MTATTRTPTAGPFNLGTNNRRPEFDLRTRDGSFLRSAVNVDISATGSVRRRQGGSKVLEGVDVHSLWGNLDSAFYVDGSTLYHAKNLMGDSVVTPIDTTMSDNRRVSYAAVGSDTFYSNGDKIGRINAGRCYPLGVSPLVHPPVVVALSGGSLSEGVYRICFAFMNADGEHSVTTVPQRVDVGAKGKISISGLPAAWPTDAVGLLVFATSANDDQLRLVQTLAAPMSALTLATPVSYGARCQTALKARMPAGDIVRELNGRLFVAVGNALYYSEPYAYALTDPARNYVLFPEPITVIEPVNNGLYVIADQTYWIAGDIASTELNPVLPYGAVAYSSGQILHKNECFWMSRRGMVVGDQNGAVRNVQEDNVAVLPSAVGAALMRENDGNKHLIASTFGAGVSQAAARSFMDAEIVRKGTTL